MVSQSNGLPKTLVIGLGNPIFGDDGLGWIVAQQIEETIDSPGVEIIWLACGGLQLMERMIGYQRAILIDTLHHTRSEPGKIFLFELDSLPPSGTSDSHG
jgi:hydrogenase maturation protease